jgi:hypothetical protein
MHPVIEVIYWVSVGITLFFGLAESFIRLGIYFTNHPWWRDSHE